VPGPAAGATARRDRWSRLRRLLWQPPRPHGEQPRERTVGPLELFYDLAVVVLVAQAARHLAGHLTWRGLGEFAVVFTLVWIAWTNGSLYHELHGHDDARSRSTFLVQILVLTAIGAFIPQAGGARGAAFAVAAAVLFAILAVLWLLASRGDRPEYRRPSRLYVTGTAACAVLLAGTALLPTSARIPAWGLLDAAYLAGFAAGPGQTVPATRRRKLAQLTAVTDLATWRLLRHEQGLAQDQTAAEIGELVHACLPADSATGSTQGSIRAEAQPRARPELPSSFPTSKTGGAAPPAG
jgi:hypothetical protein